MSVAEAGHYPAILSRNPSTSSRMFGEKNFGKSVDDGVRDSGGMCCKAFLEDGQHTSGRSEGRDGKQRTCTRTREAARLLLCGEEDSLSQRRVGLHRCGDEGGEERQVPDGGSVRHGHLLGTAQVTAQRLYAVNASVTSVAHAALDVDLDDWGVRKGMIQLRHRWKHNTGSSCFITCSII